MKINYVFGDATNPIGDGNKIIVHVCNDIGAWGAGFVLALSKRWKDPELYYRALTKYILGDIQLVDVEKDITVCNLIGQESTISRRTEGTTLPPVRYVAIEAGLKKLAKQIGRHGILTNSVHMPRIGSGLAGGNWKIIETIIEETLINEGITVTVYDLP
jgi:O-acetyl-ADP-ribose deacetylase (regulator of RNase III)